MNVTIIGTGNMSRALTTSALAGGHTVALLGRDPAKARALADELPGNASAGTIGDALSGELVVLAVPYEAVGELLDRYNGQLAGKVLVDIINPVDVSTPSLLNIEAGSVAAEIARKVPSARVVKAFNVVFAQTIGEDRVGGQPLDVFIAGDDEDAKSAVRRLIEDGGMRAVDAGPLARARELESLAFLHFVVQQSLGTTFNTAVKILA